MWLRVSCVGVAVFFSFVHNYGDLVFLVFVWCVYLFMCVLLWYVCMYGVFCVGV